MTDDLRTLDIRLWLVTSLVTWHSPGLVSRHGGCIDKYTLWPQYWCRYTSGSILTLIFSLKL